QALGAHGALEESPGKSWPAAGSSGARKNACASLHFTTESETWRGRLVVGGGTTSGISSHVRPSSTRPAYFLFLPPPLFEGILHICSGFVPQALEHRAPLLGQRRLQLQARAGDRVRQLDARRVQERATLGRGAAVA